MKIEFIRVCCFKFRNCRVFYVNGQFKIRGKLKPRHVVGLIIRGYAKIGKDGRVTLTEKGYEASMYLTICDHIRRFVKDEECDMLTLTRFRLVRNGKLTKKGMTYGNKK